MIFVTVGNAKQPFPRLLRGIDALVLRGWISSSEVWIQRGNSPRGPVTYSFDESFVAPDAFASLVDKASVVVCHGGAGSLSHVFRSGKVPVVMPRRALLGEHVDDQYLLVKNLAELGRVIPAYEAEELGPAIAASAGRLQPRLDGAGQMIRLVANAIRELSVRANR